MPIQNKQFLKLRRVKRWRELDELVSLALGTGLLSHVGAHVRREASGDTLKNGSLRFREALILDAVEKLLACLVDAIKRPAIAGSSVVDSQGKTEGKSDGVHHVFVDGRCPICFLCLHSSLSGCDVAMLAYAAKYLRKTGLGAGAIDDLI